MSYRRHHALRKVEAMGIVSPDHCQNNILSCPDIRIRAARPEENLALETLGARVFHPFGSYGKAIRDWLDSGEAPALLALSHGRTAGFAMVSRTGPPGATTLNTSELLAIAVVPDHQRSGIGRLLLRHIQIEARNHETEVLLLHTATENLAALALFEAEGFRRLLIRPRFYPRGQDAFLMFKDLRENLTAP